MSPDPSAPATKEDIRLLMEEMGKLYDRVVQSEERLQEWKQEIVDEFHVVAEDLRHDLFGITKDQLAGHEDRIVRLEKHTKLIAA